MKFKIPELMISGIKSQRDERILKILKDRVEWDEFINQAARNQIIPQMYKYLKFYKEDIPNSVWDRLHKLYLYNSASNLQKFILLKEILKAFNEKEIDLVPLKGLYLSEYLWGDFTRRTGADLDILIREEDWEKAKGALEELDYRLFSKKYSPELIKRYVRHLGFCRDNPKSYVEVHWNFFTAQTKRFDMAKIWKRARKGSLFGYRILTLDSSDLLIYSAIAIAIHGYLGLKFYQDLYEIFNKHKDELNWNYIIGRVVKNRQRTRIYYSFFFSKKILDIPIPDRVLKALSPSPIQKKIFNLLIDERKILSSWSPEDISGYYDLVRVATMDYFTDIIKTLFSLFFFHSKEVERRYKGRGLWKNLSSIIRPQVNADRITDECR